MVDVQNSFDKRNIQLTKVGVENVRRRITVKRRRHTYEFVMTIKMFLELDRNQKGANLSRFMEAIEETPQEAKSIEQYTKDVAELCKKKHEADCFVEIESCFPYEKTKPNGKKEEHIYPLKIKYSTKTQYFVLTTSSIGMSYCPCGKEMCDGMSHNQKSYVFVEINFKDNQIVKSGKIVDAINNSFSSPIYNILKRPEEKEIILKAMENAKFSEDICRDCLIELRKIKELKRLFVTITVTNDESIHPHVVTSVFKGDI